MTTVHRAPDGKIAAYTKGAMDVLLSRCVAIEENGEKRPLTNADLLNIQTAAEMCIRDR